VHAGLVGLGWSAKEADKAVDAVAPQAEQAAEEAQAAGRADEPDVAALLRAALRTLSRA
jgi:Holliday junction DNA helicase RuvA